MEYFEINPFSQRFGCITKVKHLFEDKDGKFTDGIKKIVDSCNIGHIGYPYNDKGIVGGFIIDEYFSNGYNKLFGFKCGYDKDGYPIYRIIGGKSLFYTESNHSEEELYEFLKDILYFPKDEMENTMMFTHLEMSSNYIVMK